jgi:magnesium-transporting ATPase (P-type)
MKTGDHLSLGEAVAGTAPESGTEPTLSQEGIRRAGVGDGRNVSMGWQIIIFATLTLSIIASRFIDYYRAAIFWSPFRDWQYLFFALIVSLLAFPIVYRKAQSSRNEPLLVQLGVIFAAGLGWEKMLSTAADLLKPIALK